MRSIAKIILVAIFAVVALYAIASLRGGQCDTALCCQDCQPLSVTRVIDGDTLDTNDGRVRLYGVDTPERGEQCFDEATDRLKALAGKTIRVEPGPRARDSFDRLLYYIYTESGESIDEMLVEEGLGYAWTQDGQHRDFMMRLEGKSKADSRGCLW